MESVVQLTDDERTRWHAATNKAERDAVIREVRRREREERAEQRIEDAVIRSLERFVQGR